MFQVKYVSLSEIKNQCEKLYFQNEKVTPYQTYLFWSLIGKGTSIKHPFRSLFMKECNAVLYDDEKIVMVMPLIICRGVCGTKVYPRGYLGGAGHLGILYTPECNYRHFDFILTHIIFTLKSRYKNIEMKLMRIRCDSECNTWIQKYLYNKQYIVDSQKCVSINIQYGYSEWYRRLSKSTCQNIRTSYNRMITDAVTTKFIAFNKGVIPDSLYDELIKLYCKRTAEKLHLIKGLTCQFGKLLYHVKKRNKMIHALNNGENTFTSIFYINGKVAAFLSGFVSNDKRIIVPHLSYNMVYKRYSPGLLLINETIKYLDEHKNMLNVTELDLSCGSESYKYAYGGTEYMNYHYKFNLDQFLGREEKR